MQASQLSAPRHPVPRLALLALCIALPSAARAEGPLAAARHLLDLTPERIEAFTEALREFTSGSDEVTVGADMSLVTEFLASQEASLDEGDLLDGDLVLSAGWRGHDLAADEEFFVAGREEEYEDAALDWVERRLKGSSSTWRPRSKAELRTRLAWNHGPLVGVGRGPLSLEVGQDSWRVRWSEPVTLRSGSVWRLSSFLGENEDGLSVGFTIGRSLLQSRSR